MTSAPWRTVRLDELGQSFSTGPFGSAVSAKHFRAHGIPMIRGSNLSGDVGQRLVEENLVFLDEELVAKYARSVARRGDLIFTSWGTVGQVGLVDERASYERYIVSNKQMRMTPDSSLTDPLFLYYYFCQPSIVNLMRSEAIGSSVPGFNLGQLRSLPLSIPPLPEQRAIGEVLGALDNKITENHSVAATADALCQALYREALQVASHNEEHVRSLAETVLGGTPSRAVPRYWRGEVPWVSSGKANEDRILEPSEWISDEALAGSAAKLMPRGTTVIAITGATIGQIARLEIAAAGNQSLIGVYSPDPTLNDWVYFALRDRRDILLQSATGAAQQHVNKADVDALLLPVINSATLLSWGRRVKPLLDLAAAADREVLKLAQVRDALLPGLMSGNLRVRDAERLASDAT